LVVNPDAVLAFAIANEPFEAISRQCGKILKRDSSLQAVKLKARSAFDAREGFDPFPSSKISGSLVPIAQDHARG
jgi:hypothetical protein